MSQDYILGNDQEELDRLKLQHDLWQSELLRLFDISKLKQANKVLDLGCGPGFTTLDLLSYLPQKADLTAIDMSDKFLNYLNQQVKNRNLKLNTHQSTLEDLNLADQEFEAAFGRWVLIFVQNPEKAIQKVNQHLKIGAQYIIQEYVNYDTFNLVPYCNTMKPIVDAVFKSWKDQGGDPNRGQELPHILEKNGFKVIHLEPIAKFSRPHDPLWQWPDSFFKSFLPRLKSGHYLTEKQINDFLMDWNQAKNEVGSFFVAPTVINIIAEKIK